MKHFILIVKGFIIGIANIIPGVSGGTLMITLGIYEKIIAAISHFFKDIKENIKLLLPLGIGMILSLLLLSKIIGVSLEKYPFPTTLLFIGLILGGIPLLWKKVRRDNEPKKISNWVIFLLTFVLIATFAFMKSSDMSVNLQNLDIVGVISLFLVGMVASATMIIPGISGSFMLMMLGYYKPIIDTVRNITDFSIIGNNLMIVIPFGLGIVIGIILVARLIELLLKKYEIKTYFGVLGFVLASMIAIVLPLIGLTITWLQVIIAIILFIVGFVCAYKLGGE